MKISRVLLSLIVGVAVMAFVTEHIDRQRMYEEHELRVKVEKELARVKADKSNLPCTVVFPDPEGKGYTGYKGYRVWTEAVR